MTKQQYRLFEPVSIWGFAANGKIQVFKTYAVHYSVFMRRASAPWLYFLQGRDTQQTRQQTQGNSEPAPPPRRTSPAAAHPYMYESPHHRSAP